MHKPSFTIKPMILSIGLLSLAASFTAQAAPVIYGNYTLDAEYILGASSGSTQDGMSNFGSANVYPDGLYYGMGKYSTGNDHVSIQMAASGADSAPASFSTSVYGDGYFYASSSVNYSKEYFNDTGMAQNFIFNFSVGQGELGVFGNDAGMADLLLRIRINGVEVALSQTTLTQDAQGNRSCSNNGLGLLSDYMDCSMQYGGAIAALGRDYTLDLYALGLGLIGAGESLTLDYDIIAMASFDGSAVYSYYDTNSVYSVCDNWVVLQDGDVPPEGVVIQDGGYCTSQHLEAGDSYTIAGKGTAYATAGDPLNVNWGHFVDPNPPSSDVPEPSSVALFGLAIAGLAAIRRRRA